MYFPTWVDLKGQDSVPETVHHVVHTNGCGYSDVAYCDINFIPPIGMPG